MEFTEAQRRVYGPYPGADGAPAYADPLLTRRRLDAATAGQLPQLVAELKNDRPEASQQRCQATEQALWAVCESFGLPHWDAATGQGTTADAAITLLADFLNWAEDQKKSGATTSACSTGESPASSPTPCPTN